MRGRNLGVVGANGFEPSTSWSRIRDWKILYALSDVAYRQASEISALSNVPKLYRVNGANRYPGRSGVSMQPGRAQTRLNGLVCELSGNRAKTR